MNWWEVTAEFCSAGRAVPKAWLGGGTRVQAFALEGTSWVIKIGNDVATCLRQFEALNIDLASATFAAHPGNAQQSAEAFLAEGILSYRLALQKLPDVCALIGAGWMADDGRFERDDHLSEEPRNRRPVLIQEALQAAWYAINQASPELANTWIESFARHVQTLWESGIVNFDYDLGAGFGISRDGDLKWMDCGEFWASSSDVRVHQESGMALSAKSMTDWLQRRHPHMFDALRHRFDAMAQVVAP